MNKIWVVYFLIGMIIATHIVFSIDVTSPDIQLNTSLNVSANFTILYANFSDENGFGGIITINELSDNSKEKNITFKTDEKQTIYLNIPKTASITSVTLDLKGYNYSDYVYYSFENEVYISLQGSQWGEWAGSLFGYLNGFGTFNPHVIIKTVPIDFTFNKLKLFYRQGNGDDIVFHYKIEICRVDNSNTCISPLMQIVNDFNVYHYENSTQDISLNNTYNLKKGERYKIKFSCLGSCQGVQYPSTYFEGHVGNSDEQLFHHNTAYPTGGQLLKVKLFPVPESPKSPVIDVGNNSVYEWSYSGYLLNTTTVSNLTTATNNYLSTCQEDNNGYCSVPIVFNSQSIGIMEISNINIKYPGNNSCEVCISSDGICDSKWTNNNVTNSFSGDYTNGNCTYSWNTSNYDDGIYNVSVRIKDNAYNIGTASKKITIDRTAPTFSYLYPSDNGAFSVNNTNPTNTTLGLEFFYGVNDLSQISNCSLVLNDKINKTETSVQDIRTRKFELNLSTTISGTQYYNWSITCSDIFGFEGSSDTNKFTFIVLANFSGDTTDLTKVNLSHIENLTLETASSGKIKFSEIVNLDGVSNINDVVKISYNRIEINSTAIPALNKSATLYVYNLNYTNTPEILRNNVTCPVTICKVINYSDGTLIFNVTQFSIYTTQDATASGESSGGSESSGGGSSSVGGSSGGGSSGGGGGGGGGSPGFVCNMDWKCADWSACVNGLQTRQCDFVKVPQHAEDNACPDSSKSPTTSQACATNFQSTPKSVEKQEFKETNKQQKANEIKQSQITGMAVQGNGKSNMLIASITISIIAVLGGLFYFGFFKSKT